MFYLIYLSHSIKPMNYDELSALLQHSRENNHQRGVTGMLLYRDGTFMQFLEGEKQVVLDLYEIIKKDNRHTGVYTILCGDVEERNFEDWSMGFLNMDKAGEFPNYSTYIMENLTLKSFKAGSEDAFTFMLQFNKINQLRGAEI